MAGLEVTVECSCKFIIEAYFMAKCPFAPSEKCLYSYLYTKDTQL